MPALPTTLCNFPLFTFGFSISLPSFALPAIPSFTFSINLVCPLDGD